MNDEDFVRHIFARAIDGEPSALPELDHIAANGRRAVRNRHGVYAASSVALAGAATAGLIIAPNMFEVSGGSSPALSADGLASSSKAVATPGMSKPSGIRCGQPPQINWSSLLGAHLPSGATATPTHEPTCVEIPNHGTTVEALFEVAGPGGTIEIDVETGLLALKSENPTQAPNVSPSPNTTYDPTANLDPPTTAAEQRDAARKAAEDAARKAAEAKAATQAELSSEGATTLAGKSAGAPQCSAVASGVTACVADVSKGGVHGIEVELFRTTASQLAVTVIATAPKPTSAQPSPAAPLGEDQLVALAQAVAAHF